MLLAKNMDHQKKLQSKSFPPNEWWQIWRWRGRTNLIGFLKQMGFFSSPLFLLIIEAAKKTNLDHPIMLVLCGLATINSVLAIKRRLNDCYSNGGIYYFVSATILLPLLLLPCWLSTVNETNRYGPPIQK